MPRDIFQRFEFETQDRQFRWDEGLEICSREVVFKVQADLNNQENTNI